MIGYQDFLLDLTEISDRELKRIVRGCTKKYHSHLFSRYTNLLTEEFYNSICLFYSWDNSDDYELSDREMEDEIIKILYSILCYQDGEKICDDEILFPVKELCYQVKVGNTTYDKGLNYES